MVLRNSVGCEIQAKITLGLHLLAVVAPFMPEVAELLQREMPYDLLCGSNFSIIGRKHDFSTNL